MLGALADGVDAGRRGLERVIDDDAALHLEPGTFRQLRRGPHADRDDDEIGREHAPVGEAYGFGAIDAVDRGRVRLEQHADAFRLDRRLDEDGGAAIELALHQPIHEMDERGLDAAPREPVGGLDPEQAAADDDGAGAARRRSADRRHVGEVAEGDDAGQIHPGPRQPDRVGAGRQHQAVERQRRELADDDLALLEVDGGRGGAGDQAHALAQVPGPLAEPAIALLDILRQERGQEHPVVGRRRLGADDGHVEAPGRVLAEPLEQAQRRHAVADDDEPLAVHRAPPHAANAGAA